MVGAALRDRDGRIWTGLHVGATFGCLSVCAEAVALDRAVLEGTGRIATAAAVRPSKLDELDQSRLVVPPCGACRGMLADFAPDALVIVLAIGGPIKLPAHTLLHLPYRR